MKTYNTVLLAYSIREVVLMAYCKKHQRKHEPKPGYCRFIEPWSVDELWCTLKCTESGCRQNHFLDGTPAKNFLSCDHPNSQSSCPKFEPKKWWQWWLLKAREHKRNVPGYNYHPVSHEEE